MAKTFHGVLDRFRDGPLVRTGQRQLVRCLRGQLAS